MKYSFDVTIDLGKSIPEVGALESDLNSHLTTMGETARLNIRSSIGAVTIESPTPLTQEQLSTMRDELQERFEAATPSLGVQVGNAREKSSQSGSQSTDE